MILSNLSDRGTLRGSLMYSVEDYNILANKPQINSNELVGNKTGHQLGLANLNDIIYVEANPAGTPSGDLTKLQVGDVIYNIAGQIVYGDASGTIASFDDGGDNKPLKSLKVAINPVQASGTPTPSNPLPISGWTGANIKRTGKNFVNISDKTITTQTTILSRVTFPAGTYTLSCDTINNSPIICSVRTITGLSTIINNISIPASSPKTRRSGTFTLSEATTISIICNGTSAGYNFNVQKIMLEAGETASDYVPYDPQSTTYPITWSEAGEVFGGYIDYERKKLVVNRAEYNVISTRNLTQNGDDIIAMSVSSAYRKDIIPICECFKGISKGSSAGLAVNQCRFTNNLTAINFKFSAPKTVDEWKAELANNPIQLILGLVEPIEYDLDEPVPTITTLLGNNNIWSDTGDILECVYQRDLNIVINKLLQQ